MDNNFFKSKWSGIGSSQKDTDEKVLFVDIGQKPETQRQINLYYYFLFIKDILQEAQAKDILEIGCGRGTISLYLARHLGLNVSLLDLEPDALSIAKRSFNEYNIAANYYVGDACHTGLKNEAYDAVVSIGLAEHLDDIRQLFGEQYRLLKPGGVMISLNIPAKFSVQQLNSVMKFFKKLTGQHRGDYKKDYYRNKLKPRDYKECAEKAGFEKVAITHVCPFAIFTPVKLTTDRKIAKFNNFILKIRKVFMDYPFKTNYVFSQAHFLVGKKPAGFR